MPDRQADDVPIMTTLHYVLQTQRMATISEATGRSASFLQAVSMSLVALGFVAPATHFDAMFFLLALALLTVLCTAGVMTFFRCVQLGIDDSRLAAEADTIKRFYLGRAPGLAPWMVAPAARDAAEAAVGWRWHGQTLLTNAALIALVCAALVAAAGGIAAHLLGAAVAPALAASAALFGVVASGLISAQNALWRRAAR